MMSGTMSVGEKTGVHRAGPAQAGTRTWDYADIAAAKYRAALERVAAVHARFQKELDSIGEGIGVQKALSEAAIERFRQVGPHLDSIADDIAEMSTRTRSVGAYVSEGRADLRTSIGEMQAVIEQLQVRNREMQDILEISGEVRRGVDKIAEIAIENKVIAINASITASKASDQVKGFKVIASEITKLSAAMAERVGLIVDRSVKIGERIRSVIENMDQSIGSTQVALGNIDEASGLLDRIEATIGDADAADKAMLAENGLLAGKAGTLAEALGAIGVTADMSSAKAGEIQEAMRRQAGLIRHIEELQPELEARAGAISASASEPEGPKILRSSEMAVTTYDPTLTRMLREMHYINFVCIRLLRYSSDKKIVPYLAETWFLHSDGRTWEFHLKENAVFHDGTAIGGRDVKFSLERLLNPALGSPYANLFSVIEGADDFMAGRAASVSGIVLDGEHVVRIRLKSSFNFFLSLLALSYASIIKEDRALFSKPLGREELLSAGPFRFVPGEEPGTDYLARNERFINGRPFLDGLEIRRDLEDIPGTMAQGGLDLAYNMPASSIDLFRKKGVDGELRLYTSRYCYGLVVNFSRKNFISRDAGIRRALAMSIDKDELVRGTLDGKAIRADTVLPPEMFDLGGKRFIAYDPEGARKIVDRCRAGGNLDEPLRLAFRGYITIPRLEHIAERIVHDFTQLGLRVEASFHPASASIDSFKRDYDLVFLGFLSEIDLYSALEPFINPQGGDNYYGYGNAEILAMLNDSIGIKDTAARKARFVDILEKLTLDVFSIPLFFNKSFAAIPRHVHSVFLSAEESFVPEVVFMAKERGPASLGAEGAETRPVGAYAQAVRKLRSETDTVALASSGLIGTGREIGRLIALQKDGIKKADELFASFAESAAKVQATRSGMVERIRGATEEAGKSSQAAYLIQAGLRGLSTALEGAVRALEQAKKDIGDILSIVADIGKTNEFIGSIAVNAAVISAKADAKGSDLVKVSQAISAQAKSNTANTDAIRRILDEMGKVIDGHSVFLAALVQAITKARDRVGRKGDILEKVGPLLEGINSKSSDIEATSGKLAALIRDAHDSVAHISEDVDSLALDAETLQFGLDMEQAVADILKDIVMINDGVSGFLENRAGSA